MYHVGRGMKKLACLTVLLGCFVACLGAQSVDLAVGGGSAGGGRLNYGFWPSASATAMFSPHVGLNAEFAVRGSNNSSLALGQYRPSTTDLNLVMRPAPMRWTPELDVGYAVVRTRTRFACDDFPNGGCYGDASKLQSALHLGGGVKTYFAPRWFLRFEAHWFARPAAGGFSFSAWRFGASVGYTFGHR